MMDPDADGKLRLLVRRLTDVYAIGKDSLGSWTMNAAARRRVVAVITNITDSVPYDPHSAVAKLIDMLKDQCGFVRLWSVDAIFTFSGEVDLNSCLGPLRQCFTDKFWRVRRKAMQLAGETLTVPEALTMLQDLQRVIGDAVDGAFDDTVDVRVTAVDVMGTLLRRGCREASTAILRASKSTDAHVRRAGLEAICMNISEFPYPQEAFQALVAGLKDEDGIVRVQAVNAQAVLMGDGDPLAKKRIIEALADEDARVCSAAEDALCGPKDTAEEVESLASGAVDAPRPVGSQHTFLQPIAPPTNISQTVEKALAREIDRLALAARALRRQRDEDAASSSGTQRKLEDATASMNALRVEVGQLHDKNMETLRVELGQLHEKVDDVLSGVDLNPPTPRFKSTPGTMTPASQVNDFEFETFRRERDEALQKQQVLSSERDDACARLVAVTHEKDAKIKEMSSNLDMVEEKWMEITREKDDTIEELKMSKDVSDNKVLWLEGELERTRLEAQLAEKVEASGKDLADRHKEIEERMQVDRENDLAEIQALREDVMTKQLEIDALRVGKDNLASNLGLVMEEMKIAQTERDEANSRAQALQNKMDDLVAKAQSSFRRLQTTPKRDDNPRRKGSQNEDMRTPGSSPRASPIRSPRMTPSSSTECLSTATGGGRHSMASGSGRTSPTASPKRGHRSSEPSPVGTPPSHPRS